MHVSKALRRDITKHNRRYYEEAAPTITDREYDRSIASWPNLEKNIRNSHHRRFADPACRRRNR